MISNPTDNQHAPWFVHVLVQSDCLHLRPFQILVHVLTVGKNGVGGGEKKIRRGGTALLKEGPVSESPGQGLSSESLRVLPALPFGFSSLRSLFKYAFRVGQTGLRCEYLCKSVLLCVCPAMRLYPASRSLEKMDSYIIKQVFAHRRHVCLFRKLL